MSGVTGWCVITRHGAMYVNTVRDTRSKSINAYGAFHTFEADRLKAWRSDRRNLGLRCIRVAITEKGKP